MSVEVQQKKFKSYLSLFKEVDFPYDIQEETHHAINLANFPIPAGLIDPFVLEITGGLDEYSEVTPCFLVDSGEKFVALVFWWADLLDHSFVLAVYDLEGNVLDFKKIAGRVIKGDRIGYLEATIDENGTVYSQETASEDEQDITNFHINDDGSIQVF